MALSKLIWVPGSLATILFIVPPAAATTLPALLSTGNVEKQVDQFAQQPSPDERFPQSLPDIDSLDNSSNEPILPETERLPSEESQDSEITFRIQKIEVLGSTVIETADLDRVIQSGIGNSVSLKDLQAVTQQITRLYQDRGYLTSQAVLLEQSIENGIVQIQVVEGVIEDVVIEGIKHLHPSYIRSRLTLGIGTPLNYFALEDQLRLLRFDPLLKNIQATLEAGSGVGQSILRVTVDEANQLYGEFSINNDLPPSVGGEGIEAELGYRNITGIGDSLELDYGRSFSGGAELWDVTYRLPVSPRNGAIQLRGSWGDTRLTQSPFDQLDLEGENEFYQISWREPIVRNSREEFALSLAFDYRDGQTFILGQPNPIGIGADDNGVSRTSVFRFGQDYLKRDSQGIWSLRSQFSLGTEIFDATQNGDNIPDGQFLSWLGQIQRLQRLNNDHLLVIRGDLQLAFDSLLTSEQFVIGGRESLRGYRQNVRTGDNGFRLSVEDRITLERNQKGKSTLQLIPFADIGVVWNNNDNPNPQASQRFLAGIGTGLLWEPVDGLNLRLDYGLPLIDLDDRGDNIQDDGFYFSASYRF
ncbi:ShlB/FhaC/HecB family hemolysin secretion/activation protein [Leptothoe sp. ISB3NOV94-8A]